jgi:hypothetical protein
VSSDVARFDCATQRRLEIDSRQDKRSADLRTLLILEAVAVGATGYCASERLAQQQLHFPRLPILWNHHYLLLATQLQLRA